MEKYTKTYNVILDNMDLNDYRLKPTAAIMYVQDAFARLTATKKLAAYDLFPENIYWVIADLNLDFTRNLPFWSEEIKVEIWISEITKLKIYTDYRIYYNNEICANGNACWFLVDTELKRPVKTDRVADKFEIVPELVCGEHKKFVLPEINEIINKTSHTNNLFDIDFNNHVNNKSYINMANLTTSENFKKNRSLKKLSIKFNKESFVGDVLTCVAYSSTDKDTVIHKIEKDGIPICDVISQWREKTPETDILHYDLSVKKETAKI